MVALLSTYFDFDMTLPLPHLDLAFLLPKPLLDLTMSLDLVLTLT